MALRDARRRAHAEQGRDPGGAEGGVQLELPQGHVVEPAEIGVRHARRQRGAHDRAGSTSSACS